MWARILIVPYYVPAAGQEALHQTRPRECDPFDILAFAADINACYLVDTRRHGARVTISTT
jgi:hypothetical protein